MFTYQVAENRVEIFLDFSSFTDMTEGEFETLFEFEGDHDEFLTDEGQQVAPCGGRKCSLVYRGFSVSPDYLAAIVIRDFLARLSGIFDFRADALSTDTTFPDETKEIRELIERSNRLMMAKRQAA